jgi:hypothetical protein
MAQGRVQELLTFVPRRAGEAAPHLPVGRPPALEGGRREPPQEPVTDVARGAVVRGRLAEEGDGRRGDEPEPQAGQVSSVRRRGEPAEDVLVDQHRKDLVVDRAQDPVEDQP